MPLQPHRPIQSKHLQFYNKFENRFDGTYCAYTYEERKQYKDECIPDDEDFIRFPVQRGETLAQGLIAGWIFVLFMAVLFCDETLRHSIPSAFGDFLAAAVVTTPIWIPIILYHTHKKEKEKKQVVEIEVIE